MKQVLTLLSLIIILFSCQKELSGEGSPVSEVDGFPLPGLLKEQQAVQSNGTASEKMVYSNSSITEIQSNQFPNRRIIYKSAKIDVIEYYTNQNGIPQKEKTEKFEYDQQGNVITIYEMDTVANQPLYPVSEYTYNANKTISSKKLYYKGNMMSYFKYLYTGGNVTTIIDNADNPSPADYYVITYDSRTNNFTKIDPQYYFLDIQTYYGQNYYSEMLYFSQNYPNTYNGGTVTVEEHPTSKKPTRINVNNTWEYKYNYY